MELDGHQLYVCLVTNPITMLTFMLTPPLAALRNLLLFSISEEFTTFQHIRPGVGWGVGLDVNVHLHLHTTWMLRCCYVGHGLGWGGMLTFICTCTPRGTKGAPPDHLISILASKKPIILGGPYFEKPWYPKLSMLVKSCLILSEIAASQLPKRPAPLTAAWPCL